MNPGKHVFAIRTVQFFVILLLTTQLTSAQSLKLLKDIGNPDGNVSLGESPDNWSIKLKNEIYFTADDGVHGTEIWITDGTPAGTRMIKDIRPGSGSGVTYPLTFSATDELVFFGAPDNTDYQYELWRTDGTAAGTFQVTNFADTSRIGPGWFTPCNNKMFFLTTDNWNRENLWVTDGTPEGTKKVSEMDNVYPCLCVNNLLYFKADIYTDNEMELWRTDGTSEGTFMIKNNLPGDNSWNYGFGWFPYSINNNFFFTLPDQVWQTDGTIEGTSLVESFTDEYELSRVSKKIDDDAYFTRDYGPLWTTTGIETKFLQDFSCALPLDFKKVNGITYFVYLFGDCSSKSRQKELWKTDGTPEGTVFIKNIGDYGDGGLFDCHWTTAGGKLIFEGQDNEHGRELWISDGTSEGTKIFQELLEGPSSSNISHMTQVGSSTYFLADDDNGDRQIWRLGTEGKARKVTKGNHIIHTFVLLNNRLIANATSEQYGVAELFYYDLENDIELSMFVYPNPTSTNTIQLKSDINFSYQILNAQGQVIREGVKEEEIETIHLNGMYAGMYTVVARTDKNLATRKFIIR